MKRPLLPIALAALLPALLAGCGSEGPPPPPPVTEAALAAVSENPGASREALARAIDALFTRDDIGTTRAVLVLHAGEIAAERYAEPYTPETRFVGWSMAKTVTGVMIGMLVAEGKLRLDDSPPIDTWQRPGDPRGEITLRQLLQMRSGLRHVEAGDPPYESSEVRMLVLDGRDDMARWAEAQPLAHEPGRVHQYSTNTTIILADIAARVLAPGGSSEQRRRAVAEFLATRLFDPLGMASAVPEYDAAGTMIGGSLIHANLRDWGKFGELFRHGGSHEGVQLVPRGWIRFMESPSPRAPDYGAQLWLNRPSGTDREVLFADRGPADLVGMVGHLGQYVLVSPSLDLTVVRLGKTDGPDREALEEALADVVQVYQGK
jgi:CubicO group peptidase (beta-lactamase class C family)